MRARIHVAVGKRGERERERERGGERMDGWMVVASSYGLRSSVEGEREGGPDQKLLMAAFPPLSLNGSSSHIPPCINFARDISDPPS